jgi:hypothetical protein
MKLNKIVIALLLFSQSLLSEENHFGLGVILGQPTGLSAKFELSNANAIDAALAWSYAGFHMHSDYLWNHENYFSARNQNFDLYYGIGGRLLSLNSEKYKNQTSVAVRAPVGINYKIKNTRLQIFGDLALNFNVTPRSDIDFDAGIGIRLYF